MDYYNQLREQCDNLSPHAYEVIAANNYLYYRREREISNQDGAQERLSSALRLFCGLESFIGVDDSNNNNLGNVPDVDALNNDTIVLDDIYHRIKAALDHVDRMRNYAYTAYYARRIADGDF